MNILKVNFWLLVIVTLEHSVFMWDMEYLLHYILNFNREIQAQEINWFISEHLDTKSSENFQQFFKKIHRNSSVTQMVFSNNDELRIDQTSSKRNYIGIVMTTGPEDPIMKVHDRVLQGRHVNVNFVVLVKPLADDFAVAERLLQSLSRKNFQTTLLYVNYLNGSSALLGLELYPKFSIKFQTNALRNLKQELKDAVFGHLDCQGFQFLTPLRLDLPGVFSYINRQNAIERHGVAFHILNSFMEYTNASLVPYPMPADNLGGMVVNMRDTLKLIRSKQVLITPHAYALFNPDEHVDKSYPLLLTKWCLMVPIRNTVSSFYYPVVPFDRSVWIMLIISYISLAIIDGLWIVWEAQKKRSANCNLMLQIYSSAMDNFCYMLNITASKNIKRPSRIKFLLYMTVFFHAFFISASYTSLLGSILTVNIFKEEINSMEDLIKANLSTMIIDYELEFLLKLDLNLPYEFLRLIIPVDPATFHLHQSTLNQSNAYFVTEGKWFMLRRQQDHLRPGLFKLTDICFGSFHLGYPLETDSPLKRALGYYILRIDSSGLLYHFAMSSFLHATHAGYVQYFKSSNEHQAAGLSHVSMVFLMLIIIYIICVFIFIGERLHYRLIMKKHRKQIV